MKLPVDGSSTQMVNTSPELPQPSFIFYKRELQEKPTGEEEEILNPWNMLHEK